MAIVQTGSDTDYIYYQETNAVNGETAYIRKDRKTGELSVTSARVKLWDDYAKNLSGRMP